MILVDWIQSLRFTIRTRLRCTARRAGHPRSAHPVSAIESLESRHLLSIAAVDDTATVEECGSVDIYVMENDTDAMWIASVGILSYGDAGELGGYIDYAPYPGFTGTDSFTYSIDDGLGNVASATVTVYVNNAPEFDSDGEPDADPDAYAFSIAENSANGTVVGSVIANDSDAGDTLSYWISFPGSAFALNSSSGQLTVMDSTQLDFETSPTLTLEVKVYDDATGMKQDIATVTVNLSDVNEAPVANYDGPFSTPAETLLNIDVLINDGDPENSVLSIVIVSSTGGSAEINENGTPSDPSDDTVDFTPATGFVGTASFTYLVNDGTNDSNPVTVTIDVAAPTVEFTNMSRNGDRVVSAKDTTTTPALPGGTKELTVAVSGNATVTLTIATKTGGSGTAVFSSTNAATRTVTGTQNVTIKGRNVSNGPRDVEIKASFGGQDLGTWDFTVFRVDVTPSINGNVEAIVPTSVTNHSPTPLTTIFKGAVGGNTDLGHRTETDFVAYGGIVLKGTIVPSGMDRDDFNLMHSRSSSFDWTRSQWFRTYNQQNCIQTAPGSPYGYAANNRDDDLDDKDEDLTPDADGSATDLHVWVVDAPTTVPGQVPSDGLVSRERNNFEEIAEYAGVYVSARTSWSWSASIENPAGPGTLSQLDDVPGDNQVRLSHVWRTWNLQAPTNPAFTVTGIVPGTISQGGGGVNFTITGTNLHTSPNPCDPYVRFEHTVNTDIETEEHRAVASGNANATGTQLTGLVPRNKFDVVGQWTVSVFLGERYQFLTVNVIP